MKKVVIVDDEPDLLEMIKLGVESAGHTVITATNGLEGLEKVRLNKPDLIISDVLMPVMDGYQFYKELKKNRATLNIPVLILTARGKMEDTFKVAGVDEFLTKPVKNQELLEKVNKLLNYTKTQGALRVLIAGPEKVVIGDMASLLKNERCQTSLITTGAQVLSEIVVFLPQILILDVIMEDMESSDIVKNVRSMPLLEKIPIILYSLFRYSFLGREVGRLDIDESTNKCMELGATESLKVLEKDSFVKEISKYLKR